MPVLCIDHRQLTLKEARLLMTLDVSEQSD